MDEKIKDKNIGKKQINAKKVFLYALGVGAAGGAIYLTIDHFKKKKLQANALPENTSDTIIINNSIPASNSTAQTSVKKQTTTGDNFPLKRGSRGTRVTKLQQALVNVEYIN